MESEKQIKKLKVQEQKIKDEVLLYEQKLKDQEHEKQIKIQKYDNTIDINKKIDFSVHTLTNLFFEDLSNIGPESYIETFHLTKSFKYFNSYHAHFYQSDYIYKIYEKMVYSYANFKNSFDHLKFECKKKKIKFTELYNESKYKNVYSTFDFEPNKTKQDDKYNMFSGFKYDSENNTYDKKIIKPFLNHIKYLCNDDENAYNYVLNWFSHIIQKPEEKTKVALIFYSLVEGIGKNILTDIINEILEGYIIKFKETTSLTDRFNSEMSGKLFVVGDEINARAQEIANELKDMITRPKEIMEFKGKDKIMVNDYKNYFFTTNNENVFKISNTDRRYMFVECPIEKKDKQYYKVLFDILKDENILKNIYNYFKTKDIKNFIPSEIVMTEFKKNLLFQNIPAYLKFILEESENYTKDIEYTTTTLYKESINYAKKYKMQSTYSEKLFCMQFKKVFEEYNYLNANTRRSVYKFPVDLDQEKIKDLISINFINL